MSKVEFAKSELQAMAVYTAELTRQGIIFHAVYAANCNCWIVEHTRGY